jgi:hypothetical protein
VELQARLVAGRALSVLDLPRQPICANHAGEHLNLSVPQPADK